MTYNVSGGTLNLAQSNLGWCGWGNLALNGLCIKYCYA